MQYFKRIVSDVPELKEMNSVQVIKVIDEVRISIRKTRVLTSFSSAFIILYLPLMFIQPLTTINEGWGEFGFFSLLAFCSAGLMFEIDYRLTKKALEKKFKGPEECASAEGSV